MASFVTDDRREKLRAAAERVRRSMSPAFRRMSAPEIMEFLRGASTPAPIERRGKRQPD
jgi:hypothetical protein